MDSRCFYRPGHRCQPGGNEQLTGIYLESNLPAGHPTAFELRRNDLGDQLPEPIEKLKESERIARAERLWLFLDYDGTLADFAPTPEDIIPDTELLTLLANLSDHPNIKVAIVSGRRLDHVKALVPLPGILLSGTYGIEIQIPDNQAVNQVDYDSIRPALEAFKPRWEDLISEKEGFFLEDKGWSLAIHARLAEEGEAEQVISNAQRLASQELPLEPFRVLGGHRFIEIGPQLASKGKAVQYLIDNFPWPGALPVFIGDDDKDEEAFEVVRSLGGVSILVAPAPRPTFAQFRLDNIQAVRRWLEWILTQF
jgi:trehalose 6-phosphate phosphatase